ncbi:hypothetical protein KBK19_17840 [Microvirga sp. STR05]|uniref:Outer membrane protein beta-barrel domain-containing protein n=1 Tax=Hymenobacter duratus TaxID=2771356 RepID=A0ABR8JMS7_9BACT|nr:hypothetical protein [Hymenobacter duratus]MBD2716911.1 hypothetical protein [Hymenobacter duratus]MBR7951827.1 hypothetical protein [Microvirga sp. STR05]
MKLSKSTLIVVLGLSLLAAAKGQAQRVLLQSTTAEDTVYEQFGPNRAFFNHLYLGYMPVVGRSAGNGAKLRYGSSAEFMVGVRNKFRLSEPLSIGFDLRFVRLTYDLAQTSGKLLPTADLHYRESLAMSQVQVEGFVRLNAGQRGDAIGRYLDLTGWGGWALSTAHRFEDRPGTGPKKVQQTENGLPYLRRWSYGVGARLGSSRYAAVARYRLSDTFTSDAGSLFPELPRWTVGVELGWL